MTDDGGLLKAALWYASLGWRIFPCKPGQKYPLTKHGCNDASSDERTIRAWWQRWPTANIALACGPDSGIAVVDIDLDLDKNQDGWESLKEWDQPLPETVRQTSPRGGAHYLYTCSAGNYPANKNEYRNGIDIRSAGYYIILSPSIHPNGKAYQWAEGAGPDEIKLADYPDWMRPENEKPRAPWLQPKVAPTPTPKKSLPVSSRVEERAIAYLQECEAAIQGHAGHDKLLWAARAMVVGFELDEGTATRLLWDHYNPRCTPPWDQGDAKDRKDFERKVSQVRQTPGQKPRGWLLEECGLRISDEQAIRQGALSAANLTGEIRKRQGESAEQPVADPELPDSCPPDLLQPPGLVGEICSWINSTSLKHQPVLALGCALVFCGSIMGRKVRDEWDNRTNLYVMGVAPSSAGKDHARTCVKRLCTDAGWSGLLGGEDVTSDAAIEARLVTEPTTLFLWDEVGHMMGAIRQSTQNAHLSKIVPTLMKLYSSAKATYVGKEYSTQDRREIHQPCCCVYGTTTPEKLCAGISPSEIEDGWLGRQLVFITEDRPRKDYDRARRQEVPPHLIASVQSWHERRIPPPDNGRGDIAQTSGCWQMVVPTHPKAHKRFLAFEAWCDKQAEEDPTGKGVDKLLLKAGENARKIALVLAAGERYDNPEILEHHADYACRLIRWLVERLIELVKDRVASNKTEEEKQRIYRVVKLAGKKGVSKTMLTRQTQGLSKRTRDDHLADLVDAGYIHWDRLGGKGGKQRLYDSKHIEEDDE